MNMPKVFEIYRTSEPYNDSNTPQPCPEAKLFVLDNGKAVWCVKINDYDDLRNLYEKHSIILSKFADNAPFVDGSIEIYDDYRE